MNKKIEFEENGEKYTLEYNRESIAVIESMGFEIEELTKKPMLMLPLAFQGLFYKNHKRVKKSFIDDCFDRFTDKEKLLNVIAEMLAETYDTLTEDENETVREKGNVEWKIVG